MDECFSNILSQYPFTETGKGVLARISISVSDFTKDEFKPILNDAASYLGELVSKGPDAKPPPSRDIVLVRYLAYVLSAFLDKKLWRRIADSESKVFSKSLANAFTLGKVQLSCVKYLSGELGVRLVGVGELASAISARLKIAQLIIPKNFTYAISVWDYLRNSPRNDPNWMLGTRPLVHGYVLMTTHDILRVFEEIAESRVMSIITKANSNIDLFKPIADKVKDRLGIIEDLAPRARQTITSKRKVVPQGDPPCMVSIINELRSGGNPSHMARFALAAYLARKCLEVEGRSAEECVEEVLEPFTHAADYNEKIARYQVEHIMGLRGGRKLYMPPSCQEMNTLGLCPTNMGCGVKNPIQFLKTGKPAQ